MTDKHTTTRRTALTTIGAAAASVAGCLGNDTDDGDGTFRIGSPWNANRDPLDGGHTLRRVGITEALVGVDDTAEPVPELAAEWQRIDELSWRFTLRDGVRFHDGEPLEAGAVVDSLRRTAESNAFASVPIGTVEPDGESALRVTTREPFSPLPAHLSRNEAAVLAPASFEGGELLEPVSTGPFVFESLRPGSELRAVRNDDYYGPTPAIEAVRYEVVEDDQTRRIKLESGELEMARILPNGTVDPLESDPDIDVYTPEIPRIRFLTFDTESAPFADPRARRAVAYAVDRAAITDSILEGVDNPAVGPLSPELTDWAPDDLEGDTHDTERAAALLEAAGWVESDGGRSRNGDRLAVELLTFDARQLPLIAEVIQDQLGAVGIDVDVRVVEYGSMLDRVENDAFDAYLTSWGTLWYPDPDRLTEMFHSEAASLHHGYENDEVDALLEAARAIGDRTERRERYHDVQSKVVEDAPIVALTNYTNVIATAAGVEGYTPHPTEVKYGLENVEYSPE